jgi:hypothetical protein
MRPRRGRLLALDLLKEGELHRCLDYGVPSQIFPTVMALNQLEPRHRVAVNRTSTMGVARGTAGRMEGLL